MAHPPLGDELLPLTHLSLVPGSFSLWEIFAFIFRNKQVDIIIYVDISALGSCLLYRLLIVVSLVQFV